MVPLRSFQSEPPVAASESTPEETRLHGPVTSTATPAQHGASAPNTGEMFPRSLLPVACLLVAVVRDPPAGSDTGTVHRHRSGARMTQNVTSDVGMMNTTSTTPPTSSSDHSTSSFPTVPLFTPGDLTASVTPPRDNATAASTTTEPSTGQSETTFPQPRPESGNDTTASTPVTHTGNDNTASTPVTHTGNDTTASTPVTHTGNYTTASTPVTHTGIDTTASTQVTHTGNYTTASTLVTHTGNDTTASTPVTHTGNDTTASTPGFQPKHKGWKKSGSYDLNPEGMNTFKGKNPSRYSYLVQGHENPYFLPGEGKED
ncbi:Variant surface antigen F [Liparis tanakae]|uniref:Variant surface antigen F n=1 Tax=Liparis tanakae TaxID=230148 RepID=A0A4Z2J7C4_9TELE|nr:Variant surface antigen F [Liparis tanakae]